MTGRAPKKRMNDSITRTSSVEHQHAGETHPSDHLPAPMRTANLFLDVPGAVSVRDRSGPFSLRACTQRAMQSRQGVLNEIVQAPAGERRAAGQQRDPARGRVQNSERIPNRQGRRGSADNGALSSPACAAYPGACQSATLVLACWREDMTDSRRSTPRFWHGRCYAAQARWPFPAPYPRRTKACWMTRHARTSSGGPI